MNFKCPYEPRDASTCTDCPNFNECLENNSSEKVEDSIDHDEKN